MSNRRLAEMGPGGAHGTDEALSVVAPAPDASPKRDHSKYNIQEASKSDNTLSLTIVASTNEIKKHHAEIHKHIVATTDHSRSLTYTPGLVTEVNALLMVVKNLMVKLEHDHEADPDILSQPVERKIVHKRVSATSASQVLKSNTHTCDSKRRKTVLREETAKHIPKGFETHHTRNLKECSKEEVCPPSQSPNSKGNTPEKDSVNILPSCYVDVSNIQTPLPHTQHSELSFVLAESDGPTSFAFIKNRVISKSEAKSDFLRGKASGWHTHATSGLGYTSPNNLKHGKALPRKSVFTNNGGSILSNIILQRESSTEQKMVRPPSVLRPSPNSTAETGSVAASSAGIKASSFLSNLLVDQKYFRRESFTTNDIGKTS